VTNPTKRLLGIAAERMGKCKKTYSKE